MQDLLRLTEVSTALYCTTVTRGTMTTEYGKILLQQMEQQRRQRLQQRAEERGLPFPPDVHQRHLPDATPTRSPGWVAEASIPGGIGDEVPRDAEVSSTSSCALQHY